MVETEYAAPLFRQLQEIVENGAPPGPHTHPLGDCPEVVEALDGKAPLAHSHPYAPEVHSHDGVYAPVEHVHEGGPGGPTSWNDLTDKPTEFPPEAHNQAISTITGLQTALDGKQASGSYALTTHNHDASYSAVGHTHAGVYEPANANIQQHVVSAHAPANAQKNSDILKAEIEAKLTGEISTHTHAAGPGGADPWTIVALAADFPTTSATAVDAGLSFTPAANGRYMFEAVLGVRTATATVNPRVGLAWATGMTDGVAQIDESQSATARLMANGNIAAPLLVAVGGIPNTTQSWPVTVWGWVKAGASPSGAIRIQLASETAGTTVRITAHSYLRFRSY